MTVDAVADYEKSREEDAAVRKQHDAYWEKKRKESRELALRRLEEKYVTTLEYWEKRVDAKKSWQRSTRI